MTRPQHLEPQPDDEASRPAEPPPVTEAPIDGGLTPANVLALQHAGAGNHAIATALAARRPTPGPLLLTDFSWWERHGEGEQEQPGEQVEPHEDQDEEVSPPPFLEEPKAEPAPAKKRKKKKRAAAPQVSAQPQKVLQPPQKTKKQGSSLDRPRPDGVSKNAWQAMSLRDQDAMLKKAATQTKSAEIEARGKASDEEYERVAAPQRAILIPKLQSCLTRLRGEQVALQKALTPGEGAPASNLVETSGRVTEEVVRLERYLVRQAQKADPKVLNELLDNTNGLIAAAQQTRKPRRAVDPAVAWQRLTDVILVDVPNTFARSHWNGRKGPDFGFKVSRENADRVKQFCFAQFHHKEIENWQSKRQEIALRQHSNVPDASLKVKYYVTTANKSGAAFDITAHAFVNGVEQFESLVVLHVMKDA